MGELLGDIKLVVAFYDPDPHVSIVFVQRIFAMARTGQHLFVKVAHDGRIADRQVFADAAETQTDTCGPQRKLGIAREMMFQAVLADHFKAVRPRQRVQAQIRAQFGQAAQAPFMVDQEKQFILHLLGAGLRVCRGVNMQGQGGDPKTQHDPVYEHGAILLIFAAIVKRASGSG